MAQEEKLQEISPLKFGIILVVAAIISTILVIGIKKVIPALA